MNRHHDHSINAMIVSGVSGRIYSVLCDTPGKYNDASIFRNSALFKLMDEQKWRPFDGAVLLGDSAYMVRTPINSSSLILSKRFLCRPNMTFLLRLTWMKLRLETEPN